MCFLSIKLHYEFILESEERMKKFNYRVLTGISFGILSLTLVHPISAQAAVGPTAKITSELKGYYAKTSSYFKEKPSRVFITDGENPDYNTVVIRDSLGNFSNIAKNYHYTYIDGFIYSDNPTLRSTSALKVAERLGLDTSAKLSKITNFYWTPAEIGFKIWSSPVFNYDVNNDILSERNMESIPESLKLYIDTLRYSKGASMKLSNKGSTRTYSWGFDKSKFAVDGKVTIVVEKGLITQFSFYTLEKKSYKLYLRIKFDFKNYTVSTPKGPYLEYDEILADPEFTEELYNGRAREGYTSVWNIILGDAIKHSLLGEGLYVTVEDINKTVSSYNDPWVKFTQYTQAIESSFKSVKGELIYLCSTLPQDVMANDILKAANGDPAQIPFSIVFQRCSELGYTLSNQGL